MSDTRAIMEVTEGTEEDRKFEGALNSILHMDKKDYPAYVGGLKIASGHEFPVASPVDNSIIFGTFQEPEEGLTDRAVIVAKEAFSKWSAVDPADRMEIFDKALDNIIRQKYRIAALVTLSSGMTRDEALDEVERLIEVIDDGCQDLDEGINGSPAGVWAILSEYNSPLAAPMGYAAAAMMAGNTVVIIPSKYTPAPIFFVYEMFVKAGLPDGVLNIITDRFDSTTNSLANNMDVSGIVAIGSGDRLENLMFLQADEDLRFINEIKG
ncbi:MAG: aldehyde dehydrogenase family protein, partial [Candidatus Methanomethylophilaceae archaeon]|nr:aldehyde dehydrogenase family protein [Candidatus Methanomethylophilaceae archaeon]